MASSTSESSAAATTVSATSPGHVVSAEDSLCHNSSFHISAFSFLSLSSLYGGIPEMILVNLLVCLCLFPLAGLFWFVTDFVLGGYSWRRSFGLTSWGDFWNWIVEQAYDQRTIYNHLWLFLDKQYLTETYGEDSMQYLCFQRYIIGLLTVLTLIDMAVILPVNMLYGSKFTERHGGGDFARTTMGNLEVTSPHLWVHLVAGWLFLPIALLFMRSYAHSILSDYIRFSEYSGSTLVVSHIPVKYRSPVWIKEWFDTKYPFIKFEEERIFLTYEVSELYPHFELYEVWTITIDKLQEKKARKQGTGRAWPTVSLYRCGCPFNCCKKSEEDADEFYEQKMDETRNKIVELWFEKRKSPFGVAFVQVANHEVANFIVMSEKLSHVKNSSETQLKVKIAPRVEELEWVNLAPRHTVLRRQLCVIVLLLVFLIVFTTPQAFFHAFFFLTKEISGGELTEDVLSSAAFSYATTLLKVLIRPVINSMFNNAIKYIGYWRQLEINRKILGWATLYLVVSLLVMPTLGFLAVPRVIQQIGNWVERDFTFEKELKNKWNCVFLPQGGLTFVNFVITSAFIGNAVEYLRFGDIFYTMLEVAKAYCREEASARVFVQKTYFWFGDAYSFELFYFILVVSLSSATPIIMPFGLLLFLIRHVVATHNLKLERDYYITNIGTRFHLTAITYVAAACVLLQMYNALYFNLKVPGEGEGNSHAPIAFVSGFTSLASIVFVALENSTDWKRPLRIVKKRKVLLSKPFRQDYVNPYFENYLFWMDKEADETFQQPAGTQTKEDEKVAAPMSKAAKESPPPAEREELPVQDTSRKEESKKRV